MGRLILGSIIMLAVSLPAQGSNWLCFESDGAGGHVTRTTRMVIKDGDPTAGIEMPAGALAVEWTPDASDSRTYPGDYLLDQQAGTVSFSPPAPPAPPANPPRPDQLKHNIFISQTLPTTAKVELYRCFPLIDVYGVSNVAGLQVAWAQMKAVYGSTWLTAGVAAEVESIAQAANIPLVP